MDHVIRDLYHRDNFRKESDQGLPCLLFVYLSTEREKYLKF